MNSSALFTLDVCINVTIKVQYRIYSDANANTDNGSDILCVNICVAIDTMLNFDGDANGDIKCEQALI